MKVKLKYQSHSVEVNPPKGYDVPSIVTNQSVESEDFQDLCDWAMEEANDIFGSNEETVFASIEEGQVSFEIGKEGHNHAINPLDSDQQADDDSLDWGEGTENELSEAPSVYFQIHDMAALKKANRVNKVPYLLQKEAEGVKLLILVWQDDKETLIDFNALEIFPELSNYGIEHDLNAHLTYKGEKDLKEMTVLLNEHGYQLMD